MTTGRINLIRDRGADYVTYLIEQDDALVVLPRWDQDALDAVSDELRLTANLGLHLVLFVLALRHNCADGVEKDEIDKVIRTPLMQNLERLFAVLRTSDDKLIGVDPALECPVRIKARFERDDAAEQTHLLSVGDCAQANH